MKFTEHMNRLIASRSGSGNRDIFRYNSKLDGRDLAMELGVPVPQLVVNPFELTEAHPHPLDGPGRDVVLKPNRGCNARGVLPLRHVEGEGGSSYECLWPDVRQPKGSSSSRSWHAWLSELEEIEAGHRGTTGEIGGPYIGEELLPGPVPTQELATVWKVYCIHGEPLWARQLVVEGRRGGMVECWEFTLEIGPAPAYEEADVLIPSGVKVHFRRIGYDVFLNHPLQKPVRLPWPKSPAIFGYAYRIAQELTKRTGSPFVRVDLLETHGNHLDGRSDVYFGEITPHPSGGKDVYHEEWDERLGRIWSRGPS